MQTKQSAAIRRIEVCLVLGSHSINIDTRNRGTTYSNVMYLSLYAIQKHQILSSKNWPDKFYRTKLLSTRHQPQFYCTYIMYYRTWCKKCGHQGLDTGRICKKGGLVRVLISIVHYWYAVDIFRGKFYKLWSCSEEMISAASVLNVKNKTFLHAIRQSNQYQHQHKHRYTLNARLYSSHTGLR